MTKFRKHREKVWMVNGVYQFTDRIHYGRAPLMPAQINVKACSKERAISKVVNIASRQANIREFSIVRVSLAKV